MSENKPILEPSDDAGAQLFQEKGSSFRRNKVATVFVPRTIVKPVIVYYNGVPHEEVRTVVRAQEYCSEKQWEMALEIEKKYPKTNKAYMEGRKARKLKTSYKEPGNPLKLTFIDVGK